MEETFNTKLSTPGEEKCKTDMRWTTLHHTTAHEPHPMLALIDEDASHVPFRSSKLTRLLQESLGGNAKTSLVVTLRPGRQHIEESLGTLRFGSRAMKVQTAAVKNVREDFRSLCLTLQAKLDAAENRIADLEGQV